LERYAEGTYRYLERCDGKMALELGYGNRKNAQKKIEKSARL